MLLTFDRWGLLVRHDPGGDTRRSVATSVLANGWPPPDDLTRPPVAAHRVALSIILCRRVGAAAAVARRPSAHKTKTDP